MDHNEYQDLDVAALRAAPSLPIMTPMEIAENTAVATMWILQSYTITLPITVVHCVNGHAMLESPGLLVTAVTARAANFSDPFSQEMAGVTLRLFKRIQSALAHRDYRAARLSYEALARYHGMVMADHRSMSVRFLYIG